jgi:hypothetical protein
LVCIYIYITTEPHIYIPNHPHQNGPSGHMLCGGPCLYALCPLPYALPYALCLMPYVPCLLPYALPYALWPLPYALCFRRRLDIYQ